MSSEALWGGFDGGVGDGQDGQWLYRYEGRLYGPIATQALLDRIKHGQILESATVAREGSEEFVPFDEVPELKEEAAKAFALWNEHKKRESAKRAALAKRNILIGTVVLVLALGGYFGTQWYVGNQQRKRIAYLQWQREQEEAAKPPQNPQERVAQAEPDIDMDLIPLVSVTKHAKAKPVKGHRTTATDEATQGCQLDQGALMSSFRTAFPQIKSCVRAGQSSGLPSQLMLSFTIANDGKVSAFEMNEGEMKGQPFNECMKRAVTGVHYPKFAGERCNIDYPISIGAKK